MEISRGCLYIQEEQKGGEGVQAGGAIFMIKQTSIREKMRYSMIIQIQ
jgi:hypothetical protein